MVAPSTSGVDANRWQALEWQTVVTVLCSGDARQRRPRRWFSAAYEYHDSRVTTHELHDESMDQFESEFRISVDTLKLP